MATGPFNVGGAQGGGGGGMYPQLIVTGPTSGSTVKATCGSESVELTENSGVWTGDLTSFGEWTIVATNNSSSATTKITVDQVKQYNVSLSYFSATIKITAPSGSTVTVKDSSGNVVNTHSGTGSAVAVKVSAAGTYYASATDGTYTTADHDAVITADGQTVEITLGFSLEDYTWAQIKTISEAGNAGAYFNVGDRKAVKINGTVVGCALNLTVYATIIGINHNIDKETNNKGSIHFMLGQSAASGDSPIALCDSNYGSTGSGFCMNTSNTNSGGWAGSYMKKTVLPALKAALPSDLTAVIRTIQKYSDNTGGGSDTASYVTATSDDLFLMAEFEVFGTRSGANSAEKNYQKQYDYFTGSNSRIFKNHSNTANAVYVWLRSVSYNNASDFRRINANGYSTYGNAYSSRGVVACFCV